MNAKPHMHKVRIDDYCGGNSQKVLYGDTRVVVHAFFFGRLPSAWRMSRAIKKAVRRHDKGSVRHAAYQASLDKVNSHIKEEREKIKLADGTFYETTFTKEVSPETWGSDLLKELTNS